MKAPTQLHIANEKLRLKSGGLDVNHVTVNDERSQEVVSKIAIKLKRRN